MKINSVSPDKQEYLQMIGGIANKPKALYYIGEIPQTRRPTVAIVGTRKPTAYGREVTTKFASEFASKGVIIVSGLALGVDTIAHTAALDAGGTTLAVLGNGLPDIYPSANKNLANRILDNHGAIFSEYSEGTPAIGFRFLERNRLVSGLADAVIITEAAARSGTLNTAMHALEQGKELFVVPGNITSAMSIGCNALIKQGATPITSVDDVLEVIAPNLLGGQTTLFTTKDPLERKVIELIRAGVRSGEEIQQKLGCGATELSMALTMLELSGAVRSLGANQWTLR